MASLITCICFLPGIAVTVIYAQPYTCGAMLPAPVFNERQRTLLDSQLQVAKINFDHAPHNADALIWYARRLSYLGRYKETIDVLSEGIMQHPDDARLYRHRGHRFLTMRCIEKGIADLEEAVRLVAGKPDETEPDGQPNEANIPTSTLQSNIFYHLGLAYFLQKNYARAKVAYEKCLQFSKHPDMYTATANWYFLTLRRMQLNRDADKLLFSVDFEVPLLENEVYRSLLKLHRDKPSPQEAMQLTARNKDSSSPAYQYGLYMYLLLHGHKKEAVQIKQQLLTGNQFAAFGYIAAEMD